MKNVAILVLGVALVADVALFAGIGFGVGALSVAPVATGSFMPTYQNGSDSGAGALTFGIWNSVQSSGSPMVSSFTPSGYSTTLTFGVIVYSNGNCGNAGGPVDAIGGVDANYFTIQFQVNGVPQSVTGDLNGASVTETTFSVGFNNTNSGGSTNPDLAGCEYNPGPGGSGNIYTSIVDPPGKAQSSAYDILQQTFSLGGQVGAGTLVIEFHAAGSNCGGSASTAVNECLSFRQAENFGGSNAGSWTASSHLYVPVIDGGASASLVGGGPWYNGGQLSVDVSTGYGGSGGYSLQVYYPSARSGESGTQDTNFQSYSPGNDLTNSQFSWTIPSGTSISCSQAGCNEFQIELRSSLFVNTYLAFPVDIGPGYAPSNASIAYSTSSGATYPSVGNSVTLTFSAQQPSNSSSGNVVSSFLIFVFYLQPNQDVNSPPGCGGQWVTPCAGTSLSATASGSSSASTSYAFTVSPPNGMTGIGVIAQSESATQQSSGQSYRYIEIQPAGCSVGQKCDPAPSVPSYWQWLGPILLGAGIVLAAALMAFVVPLALTYRIMIIAAGVAGAAVIFLFGASLFLPGGALGGVA